MRSLVYRAQKTDLNVVQPYISAFLYLKWLKRVPFSEEPLFYPSKFKTLNARSKISKT